MSSRIVRAIIDLIALVLDNYHPKPNEKELESLLEKRKEATKELALAQLQLQLPQQKEAEKSHIAPPPGMSVERYCLDCTLKHVATAKVLAREALQRAEKGEDIKLVVEKVRGVYEELTGAEDDSQAVMDEEMRALNSKVRDTRKWLFDSSVLVSPDKNKVAELMAKVSELEEKVYAELEKRSECETCKIAQ
jgi:hypothetical protein